MLFSFAHVNRSCRFLRISEARPVTNHLALVTSGEKWKAFWSGRTRKCKKTIAVNSRVTGEQFIQLFTPHAFDWITPEAFHCSNHAHYLSGCCAVSVVGREKMSKEAAGEQENNPGDSGQSGVQKPELRGRHFIEETADPADEIVGGEKGYIINADNRGGQ